MLLEWQRGLDRLFTLKATNSRGNVLNLNDQNRFVIVNIDGLEPPSATINTAHISGFDGEQFNSSYVNMRSIVISIVLRGEIERNRILLYKYFKVKQKVRLDYTNNSRNVWIEGYVEDIEAPRFSQTSIVNISILCPQPFFKDIKEIVESSNRMTDNFEFEFSCENGDTFEFGIIEDDVEILVINDGDVESGMEIILETSGSVTNPKIFNRLTGEKFELKISLLAGDKVVISTHKGNKKANLIRNGITTNIFNNIYHDSVWMQLEPFDNIFNYEVDSGIDFLTVSIIHTNLYEGV